MNFYCEEKEPGKKEEKKTRKKERRQ